MDPRYRRNTTFTGFDETCKKYPDRTALIYLGETVHLRGALDAGGPIRRRAARDRRETDRTG